MNLENFLVEQKERIVAKATKKIAQITAKQEWQDKLLNDLFAECILISDEEIVENAPNETVDSDKEKVLFTITDYPLQCVLACTNKIVVQLMATIETTDDAKSKKKLIAQRDWLTDCVWSAAWDDIDYDFSTISTISLRENWQIVEITKPDMRDAITSGISIVISKK